MNHAITDIYKSNLKHLKEVCAKIDAKKSEITTANKNDVNAYFYIVVALYNKYGCINCLLQRCECREPDCEKCLIPKCGCKVMPEPHRLVKPEIASLATWI